jgi:hypothetical protein
MLPVMQVEITGPPTLDRSYRGLPLRVPLSGTPDDVWEACLNEVVPREAIRLTRLERTTLLVFPAQAWASRHHELLDTIARAIDLANQKYFRLERRRANVSDAAEQERSEDAARADDDLASWWDGRQGASA